MLRILMVILNLMFLDRREFVCVSFGRRRMLRKR